MTDNATQPQFPFRFEPTSLPCPPWCTLERGHGFDNFGLIEDTMFRYHDGVIGSVEIQKWNGETTTEHVRLILEEHAVGNDGPVLPRRERPYIDSPEISGLTGAQARILAAVLLEAADRCDDEAALS